MKPVTPKRQFLRHTRVVRFWSEGEMAKSAFNRISKLREDNKEADARCLLDEWII